MMDKDKKSKSRIALKFSFNNDKSLNNDNNVQRCYQEKNKVKVSNDLIITTNNLKNIGKTGDYAKDCAEDPQQTSLTKGSVIQSDSLDISDEDSCDLNESFFIPYYRTEDFLISQEESAGLFSSSCGHDPSDTSKELVSYSEFLNIDDSNDGGTIHEGDSTFDFDNARLEVNKHLHADEDDTDEGDVTDRDQSQSDVQSISTVQELTNALRSNLDSEDIHVHIEEENSADDIQDSNACNNKDGMYNNPEVEDFNINNNKDNNSDNGGQIQPSNCLQGPLLFTECMNRPNFSLENFSQTSRSIKGSILKSDITSARDAKNNIDYSIHSDGMIPEDNDKESRLNPSIEIGRPEVSILPQVAVKTPDIVKSSVDRSIQTDESLCDPLASSSDSRAASNRSKDYVRSQSDRESLDIEGAQESSSRSEGDVIGRTKDEPKCNHDARRLGKSFRKLGSPSLDRSTDIRSFSKDSRILETTTEALPTFSCPDLPDREELIRWQLLAELEREKQKIMGMSPLDTELLYLRKKEKDLKNRLKKVIQRRKALESLKPSETRPRLVGDASSLDDRIFHCANSFDRPAREMSRTGRDPRFFLSSEEVRKFEYFEDSESSSVSNDVELTDRLATIEVSSGPPNSTRSERRNREDLAEYEPKRKAAFDKLCSLLGPVVKGYIVRRLFKCREVKAIVENLMEVAKKEVDLLPVINSEDCTYDEQKLFEHLDEQLSSKFNELQQIFIGSSRRRAEILADQRAFEKIFPTEKKLIYVIKKGVERRKKLDEINLFAPPTSWSAIHAPSTSQSDCNISVKAIPPTSVVQSSSSYQIQNLNGIANVAHSSSQLAGSRSTKCSGQDLRFSSFSKKSDLSKNK